MFGTRKIGFAAKPNCIHGDRIGHEDNSPEGCAVRVAEQLIQQIRVSRIDRDDYIWPKAHQKNAQAVFEQEKES